MKRLLDGLVAVNSSAKADAPPRPVHALDITTGWQPSLSAQGN
jgi:hypothetical protein